MGMVKRFLEDVADELGELEITNPVVLAEASKRWDILLIEDEKEERELIDFFQQGHDGNKDS